MSYYIYVRVYLVYVCMYIPRYCIMKWSHLVLLLCSLGDVWQLKLCMEIALSN